MAHWVLTVQLNAYDQYGDYYVKSWDVKPNANQVIYCNHLMDPPNQEQSEQLLEEGVSQQEPHSGLWSCWKLIEVKE